MIHPDISIIGRSLGTGIAVQVASQRPVAKLALVTPYNSLKEVAAEKFSYFPTRLLLRDSFQSWQYAPKIKAPTFIIVAQFDKVISTQNTQKLFHYFPSGTASLTTIANTGHNSISQNPAYLRLLKNAL